jgi:hypothetical protein
LESPGQSIRIFLAIAEVEAWFLSESTHFEKIDPELSVARIRAETGFDPTSPSIESDIHHPNGKLKQIYALVNRPYRKREAETHSLVSKLDFDEMYTTVRAVSVSLSAFISYLEDAIWVASTDIKDIAMG